MNVLVVSKKTNLELHGEKIRKNARTQDSQNEYDALEREHKEHYQTLDTLFHLLKQHHITYSKVGRGLHWPDLSSITAVITVGGDGTILEASHHIFSQDVLLIGVRSSFASVGRLCHCGAKELAEMVQNLAEDKLESLSVRRLQAKFQFVQTGGSILSEPVLNEFLFANSSPAATTRYKISIDGKVEDQKSSGVWVATACGSTAVINAAGGQRVDLSQRKLQFLVRELFQDFPPKPPKKILHGFYDPDKTSLVIENKNESAMCALDGPHGIVQLSFGDKIEFIKGPSLKLAIPQMDQN